MNESKTTYDLKFWLTLIAQIVFFMLLFIALSEWRASDMRETGARVKVLSSPTLDGSTAIFPNAETNKQTLIYFFAPWCTICHLSIENLNDVQAQFEDEVNIITVALDYQSVDEVSEFIAEKTLDYPVILGDARWSQEYKITAFPSYYIVDAEGTVLSRSLGYSSTAGMLSRLAWVDID